MFVLMFWTVSYLLPGGIHLKLPTLGVAGGGQGHVAVAALPLDDLVRGRHPFLGVEMNMV